MKELRAGPQPDKPHYAKYIRGVLYFFCLGLLGVTVYFVYRHEHSSNKSASSTVRQPNSTKLATVYDEQNRYQQAINNNLKNGNLQSYQDSELELANRYINVNNYPNAERILQEVEKNVPKNKLSAHYYQIKILDDQHNKDIVSQKSDLQTLVKMLQANSQTAEAAYYQKQLDKL